MLALALVLSLSLVTVTSVAADVHAVEVVVVEDTIITEAQYTIAFNITTTLAIGATVSIEFPADTTVPTTYEDIDVTVQGLVVSHGDIHVSGQVVTIGLREGIGAPTKVTVVFEETAGITNPTTRGYYTLSVQTSREPIWVTSPEYYIRLSDKSTYEFVYAVPEMIWVDEPVQVDVTLQTRVLGLAGYDDSVQIQFNVTEAPDPSLVTFQGCVAPCDSEDDWLPDPAFESSGYWPHDGTRFSIAADYGETTRFRLTFNRVGVYTIEFVLNDLVGGDLVVDEISVAVTGVSVEVELNKGWNLISLPIVPDDSAIGVVLADVMDNVVSVHHYRAATGTWLIYAPPDFTSLTTMEDGKAYWINMTAGLNLTVVGQAVAPPGYGPPPPAYSVVEGWNMVGFRAMEAMKAEEYLKGTDCVRIYGFDLNQGGWFSLADDGYMEPGLGYWIAFSDAGTIYP